LGTTRPTLSVMWERWRRQSDPGEIRIRPDGFSVFRAGVLEFHVTWDAIRGIAAFKRVLFTVDRVCLAFLTDPGMEYRYVASNMPGFNELLKELKQQFGIDRQDWWREVAWVPFAQSWTVLWGNLPQLTTCPDCGYDLRGTRRLRCPECGRRMSADLCPDCGGRGYFRGHGWPWFGIATAVLGAAALAVLFRTPLVPHWLRYRWGLVATILIWAGSMYIFFHLVPLRRMCWRCFGSGMRPPRASP
jgi:hypothetical protein